VHNLQQTANHESSTLNQCVYGLHPFFLDHLQYKDWMCWTQIRIKRSVPIPRSLAHGIGVQNSSEILPPGGLLRANTAHLVSLNSGFLNSSLNTLFG
jgi:hypothetical protein